MPTRTGVVGTSARTANKAKATYEYLAGDQNRSTPTDEAIIPSSASKPIRADQNSNAVGAEP